jgi:hypothetical protein
MLDRRQPVPAASGWHHEERACGAGMHEKGNGQRQDEPSFAVSPLGGSGHGGCRHGLEPHFEAEDEIPPRLIDAGAVNPVILVRDVLDGERDIDIFRNLVAGPHRQHAVAGRAAEGNPRRVAGVVGREPVLGVGERAGDLGP